MHGVDNGDWIFFDEETLDQIAWCAWCECNDVLVYLNEDVGTSSLLYLKSYRTCLVEKSMLIFISRFDRRTCHNAQSNLMPYWGHLTYGFTSPISYAAHKHVLTVISNSIEWSTSQSLTCIVLILLIQAHSRSYSAYYLRYSPWSTYDAVRNSRSMMNQMSAMKRQAVISVLQLFVFELFSICWRCTFW